MGGLQRPDDLEQYKLRKVLRSTILLVRETRADAFIINLGYGRPGF